MFNIYKNNTGAILVFYTGKLFYDNDNVFEFKSIVIKKEVVYIENEKTVLQIPFTDLYHWFNGKTIFDLKGAMLHEKGL